MVGNGDTLQAKRGRNDRNWLQIAARLWHLGGPVSL